MPLALVRFAGPLHRIPRYGRCLQRRAKMSNCRVRQPADTPEDTKLACRSSFEALDGPVLERSHSLPMSSLRRAINLILALMLVALGGGGIVYFYFIDPIWPRWIII